MVQASTILASACVHCSRSETDKGSGEQLPRHSISSRWLRTTRKSRPSDAVALGGRLARFLQSIAFSPRAVSLTP